MVTTFHSNQCRLPRLWMSATTVLPMANATCLESRCPDNQCFLPGIDPFFPRPNVAPQKLTLPPKDQCHLPHFHRLPTYLLGMNPSAREPHFPDDHFCLPGIHTSFRELMPPAGSRTFPNDPRYLLGINPSALEPNLPDDRCCLPKTLTFS